MVEADEKPVDAPPVQEKEEEEVVEETKEEEPEIKEKTDNLTQEFIDNLEEVFNIFV